MSWLKALFLFAKCGTPDHPVFPHLLRQRKRTTKCFHAGMVDVGGNGEGPPPLASPIAVSEADDSDLGDEEIDSATQGRANGLGPGAVTVEGERAGCMQVLTSAHPALTRCAA